MWEKQHIIEHRMKKIIQCCNKLNLEYVGRHIRKRPKNHSETMVQFICPNHRDKGIQYSPYSKLKNYKYGCPYCSGKYKTTTDFINQLKLINNDIQVIGQYHGCQKPITCRCKNVEIYGVLWEEVYYIIRDALSVNKVLVKI